MAGGLDMNIGMIGLGKMGLGMARRLVKHGHAVVGTDASPEKASSAAAAGIEWADSIAGLLARLPAPKIVWTMVPAGEPAEDAISEAALGLSAGDILIDGGNSNYRESIRRSQTFHEFGIHFLDIGVSGGVWGEEQGYCLMVGGNEEAYSTVEPILSALAQPPLPSRERDGVRGGYARVGESGAGHFCKMVHNGVEYAMLEAYGEGFEVLKASEFGYDLRAIASLWNQGSVVRSWLLELAELAFEKSPSLEDIKGYVEDSGEGRWTVEEAMKLEVPVPAIALSLMMRERSRQDDSFSAKLIAALRQQFGGHAVRRE